MAQVASQSPSRAEQSAASCASVNNVVPVAGFESRSVRRSDCGVPSVASFSASSRSGGLGAISKVAALSGSKISGYLLPHNKAVLSPSAGTAIPLALHARPKPRRYRARAAVE